MGKFIWVDKWLSDGRVERAAPLLCAGNQNPPAAALISKAKKCQIFAIFWCSRAVLGQDPHVSD